MPTRERVIELRNKYPCYTEQQLSDLVGVSKQRISQVLKTSGLKTRHTIIPKFLCNNCGKPINTHKNKLFCNHTCQKEYHISYLPCSQCGKIFARSKIAPTIRNIRNGGIHFFCSRKCQGLYMVSHRPKYYDRNNKRKELGITNKE